MRFHTELVPIVVAVGAAVPVAGCDKKTDGAAVDAGTKTPVVIKNREDIPVQLGGAVAPYRPPASAAPPPGAVPPAGAAPAQGAAAAASEPAAVAVQHDHPPDQPCKPLSREEVEKALADLQKQR